MVITKLFKVGRNVTKMEYPVICGHLPFCAGDVPLHPEKNSFLFFPFHPVTIVFCVTIITDITTTIIVTTLMMMTKSPGKLRLNPGVFLLKVRNLVLQAHHLARLQS